MDFLLGVRVVDAGSRGGGLSDSLSSSLVPSLPVSMLPALTLSPLPQNEPDLMSPLEITLPFVPVASARQEDSGVPEETSMIGMWMSGLVTRPPLGRVPLTWMMSEAPSCDCRQGREGGRKGGRGERGRREGGREGGMEEGGRREGGGREEGGREGGTHYKTETLNVQFSVE